MEGTVRIRTEGVRVTKEGAEGGNGVETGSVRAKKYISR
jgi:hypothetical protein